MKTRLMAGVFIKCGEMILLMKRNENKKIAPGVWASIGGHIEPEEINDPLTTLYREIKEETEIQKADLKNVRLKYITTRIIGEEIRTGYYFIAETDLMHPLPACDEGELHWVNINEMADKEMTFSNKVISSHWLENMMDTNIYLCGINRANDSATWTML